MRNDMRCELNLSDVFSKSCSENEQHIYRRTLMPKCDFNKIAKQLDHCSLFINMGLIK